jgi:hypothetical protein
VACALSIKPRDGNPLSVPMDANPRPRFRIGKGIGHPREPRIREFAYARFRPILVQAANRKLRAMPTFAVLRGPSCRLKFDILDHRIKIGELPPVDFQYVEAGILGSGGFKLQGFAQSHDGEAAYPFLAKERTLGGASRR